VPQVGGSAPTTIACSLLQPLMHLLASMREVCQVKGVMDFAFFPLFDTDQSDPGRLAAGIKFQSDRLHRTLCARSIPQANDKRHSAMHDGPLPLKQEPCSFL